MNLKGVDPKLAVFNMAFTSIFAQKDISAEAKELITKRTEVLYKLVTHTDAMKHFARILTGAKLPVQVASWNLVGLR